MDLLRFITCGSVDDGKSTLIGRLLHDSKEIYEDHLATLAKDSRRVGSAGKSLDYSLLLDGLKAERTVRMGPQERGVHDSTLSKSVERATAPKTPPCILTILTAASWLPRSVAPQQSSSSRHS